MKLTQADRDAAKAERIAKKSKVNTARFEELRAMKEEERLARIADTRFLNAIQLVAPDRYEELIRRIIKAGPEYPPDYWKRRAAKLAVTMQRWAADSMHDVLFLSELTPDEEKMTDAQFEKVLKAFALPRPKVEARERLCANPNCLNKKNRKRAPVVGGGKYCSPVCLGAALAVARRAKVGELASETRINSGD